jgi:hypothetical protein
MRAAGSIGYLAHPDPQPLTMVSSSFLAAPCPLAHLVPDGRQNVTDWTVGANSPVLVLVPQLCIKYVLKGFYRKKIGSAARGAQKNKQKNKGESVGCFYVGLRFFGLFCKMLLRVILTSPAPP